MIKLCRVDHRLLHGQVAFSWSHALGADAILIVSDEVASNEVRMKTMRLAKPVGIKLVIKGVDDSIKAIKKRRNRQISSAHRYRQHCGCREAGPRVWHFLAESGRHRKELRDDPQLRQCGHLTDEEVEVVRGLVRDGVEVEVRQVAKDKKVVLSEKDL